MICFLSGIRDEIRLIVWMLNPKNLSAAFGLAKIQEEYLLASRRSTKPWSDVIKTSILGPPPMIKNESKGTKLPIQKISLSQMEERRKKGLCYYCEDKWHTRHKCKTPRIFFMESKQEEVYNDVQDIQLEEVIVKHDSHLELQQHEEG